MNGVFFNTGLLPLSGERTPRLYAARNYQLANSQVSPDGRFVAYNANASGRFEVFVESFPTPGARWQVSKDGGVHPQWRHDGREVYYYEPDENIMAAPVGSAVDTARWGRRAALPGATAYRANRLCWVHCAVPTTWRRTDAFS